MMSLVFHKCGLSVSRSRNPSAHTLILRCLLDKEVEDYYSRGLTVPDYVTLLWSDDK